MKRFLFLDVDGVLNSLSSNNFVRTDSARGLTISDADEIIYKLLS